MEGRVAHRVSLGDGQLSWRLEQGERGRVPAEDVVLPYIVLLGRVSCLGSSNVGRVSS